MSRSSDRAQVDPIPALVAVLALGAGLSVYAAILSDVGPDRDRSPADSVLDRVHQDLVASGVADPDRLSDAASAAPEEYTVTVTLATPNETWRIGPVPSEARRRDEVDGFDRADRRVSVRVDPGSVRAGTLRVEVWP